MLNIKYCNELKIWCNTHHFEIIKFNLKFFKKKTTRIESKVDIILKERVLKNNINASLNLTDFIFIYDLML
jgi:hypothetical protein